MFRDFEQTFFRPNDSLFNDPFFNNSFNYHPQIIKPTDQIIQPSLLPSAQCQVHILEHTDKYLINAELPGIEKNNIKLNIVDNILTIAAEHKNELIEQKVDNNKKVFRKECSYGNIHKSIKT